MKLTLHNITVQRQEKLILDHVSAQITDSCAIVGISGSGKSTLAKAILGLIRYSGEIYHDDLKMALIPQDPATALHPLKKILTLMNEVCAKENQEPLLRSVGFDDPQKILQSYAHQLSGGMKQRVLIALALATNPDLLIADEPTSGLDPIVQRQIVELLASLNIPLVLITHDTGIAKRLCKQLIVLEEGRVEYVGGFYARV